MYTPTPKEAEARHKLYERIQKMIELKEKKMPHFANQYGQRSFKEYIDDSERILNGYVFSRETQDKEPWQSNMLDNITRAKMRAVASSLGLRVPEMKFQAKAENGHPSKIHADIFNSIVYQSFKAENPSLHNFNEVWHLLSHGVVFEYEGYKTGGAKMKVVKSFDSVTGEVDYEIKYVEGQGKPFNVLLNPQEFYWWDFYVRDVQDQPHVAWIQHYNKAELEHEFSKYPNFKEVKDKKHCTQFQDTQETLYYQKWSQRVADVDDYEVIRFYSKEDDTYEIWCNGVPLLQAPLLWGDTEKYYPFAKSISEPFANTNFFVGMSFPALLEAYQDQKNTIINTLIDKLYRSVEPAWLIGLQNKDLFDAESGWEGTDGRYYVPDVNAVKPMPVAGINQAELAMLTTIDRGLDSLSIDRSQQGLQSAGDKTAKEVAIADQRAREQKSMLFIFLEDLWLQKYRLRNKTILTHYIKDKAAGKTTKDGIIEVPDFCFYNGERGILHVHVAKTKEQMLPEAEIEARELAASQQGMKYKLISVTPKFIDQCEYSYEIVPQTVIEQEKATQEQEFKNFVGWMMQVSPEWVVANKEELTKESLELYNRNPDEYNPAMPAPMPGAPGMEGAMPPEQAQPQPAL